LGQFPGFCKFIQYSGVVLKGIERRRAISVEIPFCFSVSCPSLGALTPITLANAFFEIFNGARNCFAELLQDGVVTSSSMAF
jgi:hypothetical protein